MALADTGRELKKVGFLYLFVTTAWRVDGSKGHDGQSRFTEYHRVIVQPNLQAPCEPWSWTLRTTSKVTEVRVRVAPQGGRAIGNCRERGAFFDTMNVIMQMHANANDVHMLPSACIFPSIGPCQCCCLAMVRVGIRDESPPSPCMEPNNLPIACIYIYMEHICQLVFGLTYQHLPVLVLLAPLLRMLSLGKRFQTWHELGRRVPVVPAAEMPGQTPKIKRQTKSNLLHSRTEEFNFIPSWLRQFHWGVGNLLGKTRWRLSFMKRTFGEKRESSAPENCVKWSLKSQNCILQPTICPPH